MSDNSTTKEAVTCAIRHIGTGIYSSGKIKDFLIRKGYSETVAADAVKHLIDTGYIDDVRASRKVLASRSGKKQESRRFLSWEQTIPQDQLSAASGSGHVWTTDQRSQRLSSAAQMRSTG